MNAVVEVRDAHVVHRGRVYALTGADLAVAPGETVGVVGESGGYFDHGGASQMPSCLPACSFSIASA
ncbi:hypothetical protein ACWD25_62165, partial [Streptomyces sp. NPDC002920]